MNKKIKLLIIFVLSFIILTNNVLADRTRVTDNITYVCEEGYNIDNDSDNCCPKSFNYQEWAVPSGIRQAGCWNDDKKDECKKKGGKINSVGSNGSTLEKCFIKRKEASRMATLTINNAEGGIKSKTCTEKNGCKIDFSDVIDSNGDKKYIGYSEKSDCSNIEDSKKIKIQNNKTIYLCYSNMLAKCEYKDKDDTKYIISYNKTDANIEINPNKYVYAPDFTGRSLYVTYYTSGMICPNAIYVRHVNYVTGTKYGLSIYNVCSNDKEDDKQGCKIATLQSKTNYFDEKKEEQDIDTGNCTIISTEIADFINEILKWVRLIVPILLIVYGILDFSKSVFSQNEDNMKKNRERFIKRIVAAILVFLTPTFVNLILQLANMAWSWINPDICIK